jgi:hypothetical protein
VVQDVQLPSDGLRSSIDEWKSQCSNRLGRSVGAFQGAETLERESGVEPATSSLGIRPSFENRDYRVFGCLFLAIEFKQFSIWSLKRFLTEIN